LLTVLFHSSHAISLPPPTINPSIISMGRSRGVLLEDIKVIRMDEN